MDTSILCTVVELDHFDTVNRDALRGIVAGLQHEKHDEKQQEYMERGRLARIYETAAKPGGSAGGKPAFHCSPNP